MAIAFGLVISARSNNWNQSQGHEFNFQSDNCIVEKLLRGRLLRVASIVLWRRLLS